MRVNSRIKINQRAIRNLSQKAIKALEMTGEAIHTDVVQSQSMPFDSGALQNSSTFVDYSNSSRGSVSIISSTPYARRLYYHPEYNFNTSENPDAGGKWFEPYTKGGKKQNMAQKTFANIYRRMT